MRKCAQDRTIATVQSTIHCSKKAIAFSFAVSALRRAEPAFATEVLKTLQKPGALVSEAIYNQVAAIAAKARVADAAADAASDAAPDAAADGGNHS